MTRAVDRAAVVWTIGIGVAVAVVGGAAYAAVRTRALGDPSTARANAEWLLDLERSVGLDLERRMQGWWGHGTTGDVASAVYAVGYWPLLALALAWTAWRAPAVAARLGVALLLSGAVGLVAFGLFPVAPPRLLPGFVDTVASNAGLASFAHPEGIANPYAAMPSFHVGWLALAAIALRAAAESRAVRTLALVPPIAMSVAVVVTANHYLIDAAAGTVLAVVSWRLAWSCLARIRRAVDEHRPAPPVGPSAPPLEPASAGVLEHSGRRS